jgi:hypothetical protein
MVTAWWIGIGANVDIVLEERQGMVAEVVEEEDDEFMDMIKLSALLPC